MSDEQLLCDLREGGEKGRRACAQLYRRYFKELVRQLGRMHRSVTLEDREDVAQQVFLELAQERCRYDGSISILSWLVRRALARLVDQHRRDQSRLQRELCQAGGELGVELLDPPALLWTQQRRELVQLAVAELPTAQRQVVELIFLQGRSATEVAEKLACSVSALRGLSYRAKTRLFQVLRDLGD